MPNKLLNRNFSELVFLFLTVLISRIPFLFAGFGSEEDSWLLPLTAKNIALSGQYELSRAPGHPLQEIIYSCMWNSVPFYYNLLSAVMSVIAVLFFALSLKQLGFKHYLFAAYAFAFTPIVFISSTYTIDYMPAMAFVMVSFYFLLRNYFLLSGVFLGLAIGFRITSGLMLIPFCMLLLPFSKERLKGILFLSIGTTIIGLLTYLPVIKTYGFSFFTFSDQFPYPNLAKVFYKATFGVFGTIGVGTIIFYKLKIVIGKFGLKEKMLSSGMPVDLFRACLIVLVIYIISYLRLPQKSAYLIPIIPFIILMFGYFLSSGQFKLFCLLITMSSFLFSMNLTDSLRGAAHSPLSMKFTLAGQETFIDPLTGPAFSDHSKRLHKINFTKKVLEKTKAQQAKTVLICGWWYNELRVEMWNYEKNKNIEFVFYIDKKTMEKYISEGYDIYYLPEQDLYNDQFSQMNYTDSVAKPYM
ncbi:MAG: ArnT family glycosyltransferase [Bacteroidia bacterium]